jgi:DivIVA domain-containing protein
MTTEGTILTADFPRAVRGYSPIAVDDFVRQLGERLETMQSKLNEQTAKTTGLQNLLTKANKDLAAYIEKEAAISRTIISVEQRRTSAEQEIELSRQNAAIEIEELRSQAEAEVGELRARAETEAQERLTSAHTQIHDLLTAAHEESQELRSRAQLDAHDLLRTANESADDILANAQQLAEETVTGAQREADEIVSEANSAVALQGEKLRALCSEYEETAARIRRALENQLGMLPAPGSLLESLSLHGVAVTSSAEPALRETQRAA